MGHGNLYVIFKVQFPGKGEIPAAQIEVLKGILPGPANPIIDKSKPVRYLEAFNEQEANPSPFGGRSKIPSLVNDVSSSR